MLTKVRCELGSKPVHQLAALLGLAAALMSSGNAEGTFRVRDRIGITLDRYLAEVGKLTGVEHRAESVLSARPLVALNVECSQQALRTGIAELFGATWKRTPGEGQHYLLSITAEDARARARALQAAESAGLRSVRSRWDQVRRLAGASPEELRAAAERGDAKAASFIRTPVSLSRSLMTLPAPVVDRVLRTGQVELPVRSLPTQMQQAIGHAMSGSRIRVNGVAVSNDTSQAALRLVVGGTVERPTVFAVLRSGVRGRVANLLYAEAGRREPPSARRAALRPRTSQRDLDEHLRKKVTLRDPAVRGGQTERPAGARPLATLLQQFAEQVPVPVVAECEHRPKDAGWLRRQAWLAEDIVARPAAEALDLLCADFECDWQYVQGMIVIRPKLWYLDPEQRMPKGPIQPGEPG